jgi:acyl-CoA thioesterase-1
MRAYWFPRSATRGAPSERVRLGLVAALLVAAAACSQGSGCSLGFGVDNGVPVTQQEIVEPGQLPQGDKTVIVILGDSLAAGLGLTTSESFPSRLQEMFAAEGYTEVEVSNAGVSGDTTAGGRRRVEQLLAPNVRILVVALGANDALRGLSVAQTRENLAAIIDQALAQGVRVLLTGMEAPPNLGEDYQTNFRNVFTQLARDYRGSIDIVSFLLEGVAGNPALNQADGVHPNAQGARLIAEHLYPSLRDMVDQLPPGVGR